MFHFQVHLKSKDYVQHIDIVPEVNVNINSNLIKETKYFVVAIKEL